MLVETDLSPEDVDATVRDNLIHLADEMIDVMLSMMSDGNDHPELWAAIPGFVTEQTMLIDRLQHRMTISHGDTNVMVRLVLAMCGAALGAEREMLAAVEPLAASYSQSPLVQGALFHLGSLIDRNNPKYRLETLFCQTPFVQMDILERSSHLCCASWLKTSVGDLSQKNWPDVWDSDAAQKIRESIHDGSYRYCNKGACPKIQGGSLVAKDELRLSSDFWRSVVDDKLVSVPAGPETVNLAYDRTCNLSCPSCRVERYAADDDTRARFSEMQERAILPLLKKAKTVFVTGSGDPFASKNFRQLLHRLTPEDYPELRFQIMTNAMLLTPRQWESFPSIHRRVELMKVSIDAATGATHELLRRGAKWPVMMENMRFAGTLLREGLISNYELVFTVQQDNFREMGDAVDLAHEVGANGVNFARITNWGTFSKEEYRRKAVFVPGHPEHQDFIHCMQDARLRDPIVLLGDLSPFATNLPDDRRMFVR